MKAKQSQDSGVEDGMGEERETPTQRKRERTEDNVSVGPALPAATRGRHLPGAASVPQGSVGLGWGTKPLLRTRPLTEFKSSPQGLAPHSSATLSRPSLFFPMLSLSQPLGPPKGLTQARTPPSHSVQFKVCQHLLHSLHPDSKA